MTPGQAICDDRGTDAHAGALDVVELPELRDVLVRAYTTGLAREGLRIQEAAARDGMDGGLVVRSAFTALPLERLHEPLTELVAARVRLTRYLVSLGLAMFL